MSKIEFSYQDCTATFSLPHTLEQLKLQVQSKFSRLACFPKWYYVYLDEANDQNCVENQEDYQVFLEMNDDSQNTIRATIVTEGEYQADSLLVNKKDQIQKQQEQDQQPGARKEQTTIVKAVDNREIDNLQNLNNVPKLTEEDRQEDEAENIREEQDMSDDEAQHVEQQISIQSSIQAQQSNYSSLKLENKPQQAEPSSQISQNQKKAYVIKNDCSSIQKQSSKIQQQLLQKEASDGQNQSRKIVQQQFNQPPLIIQTQLQTLITKLLNTQRQNQQLRRQLKLKQQESEKASKMLQKRQCAFCGSRDRLRNHYVAFVGLWECDKCHDRYKIELRTRH